MRQLRNFGKKEVLLFPFFKRTAWLSLVMIFAAAAVFNIFANNDAFRNSNYHRNNKDTSTVGAFGKKGSPSNKTAGFKPQPYSHNQDMAFVSLMGKRPNADFSGYRKAVLYNAKGAVIQEIDISRSDSIYSLDKMIQENRTKGPLIIKMIRK